MHPTTEHGVYIKFGMAFSSTVTTGDSCIYGYGPETKQQSSLWKSINIPKPKKARQVKSEVKSKVMNSWQTKQSIPHATVTFYGHCMKMCEDFVPNFGYKYGCCITTQYLTLRFSPGNFF
jgi:hypothetical protein